MKQLAAGVQMLAGFPPNAINCYLVEDVLVDAGTRHQARSILRQLRGHRLSSHALTHAHGDHQGSSHAVCEALGIPLWCGTADVEATESGRVYDAMPNQRSPWVRIYRRIFPGPGHPVARALKEADEVAGFTVLETPGHSAGHVSFWRESDRTLICGDVFTNMDTITGIPGLHEPKPFFTPDPARNRASMRKLAALEPALVCFGHGRPLRDPEKLKRFTERVARS
jgi:hydroxyacylglutathione hydrolase